jgi:ATP-dependent helicase/nuclease subunit A
VIAGVSAGVPSLGSPVVGIDLPEPAAVRAPPSFGRGATAMALSRAAAARQTAVSASGFEGALPSVADPGLAKGPRDLELAPWHKGRYGTAIGRAVHGVLQTVDLGTGAGLDDALAAQVLAEGVTPHAALVAELVSSALASPLIKRAAARPHWRESYAATVIGDKVLEGVIDLLYRDDDGLVVVDYKTDAVPLSALSARVDFYRPQMAAYAAAVEAATGEPVARCVLLFLSPTGAEAWNVPALPAAVVAIRGIASGVGAV